MKTLIAYTTQHGATKNTATYISELLEANSIEICDLRKNKPKLNEYDRIILGASIHAGKIQRRMKRFMHRNKKTLAEKEIGLYLCCMHTGDTAQKQFDDNYPEDLRQHAKATAIVGGSFDFEAMNMMERAIVKKVANINESVNKLDKEKIEQFVKQLTAAEEK